MRAFEPGSTGWSAADLDDPRYEHFWAAGKYEIIDGVIAQMAPAYMVGIWALKRLCGIVEKHLASVGQQGDFLPEMELMLTDSRVLRPDAALVTPEFAEKQIKAVLAAQESHKKKQPDSTDIELSRVLIPPFLIIESISPGHERHDEQLKRGWYAEFAVPNYWLINSFTQTMRCYRLVNGTYELDAEGRDDQVIRPSAFAGLAVPLDQVWVRLSTR